VKPDLERGKGIPYLCGIRHHGAPDEERRVRRARGEDPIRRPIQLYIAVISCIKWNDLLICMYKIYYAFT
jgi:hypothetical protein